jgi:hypothetical protein
MFRLTSLTTISLLLLTLAPSPAQALSFGEAVGIGAGALVINEAVQRGQRRSRGSNPEAEFNQGVQDGFARARYDNPRSSRDYSKGFDLGVERRQNGWRGPFRQ